MTKEQYKKMQTTKCKNCGENIDISATTSVRKLVAQTKTLKESLSDCEKKCMTIRLTKNGEIQKLHLTISQILKNLCDTDKKKVYEFIKDMRKTKKP